MERRSYWACVPERSGVTLTGMKRRGWTVIDTKKPGLEPPGDQDVRIVSQQFALSGYSL